VAAQGPARIKLACLKHGRDGRLIVVSEDLSTYADAGAIAPTLQAALDDWAVVKPDLETLADDLAKGTVVGEPLNPVALAAPLPRAYQ
jgi:fumarylacetoacetate (FAA) hydrolase